MKYRYPLKQILTKTVSHWDHDGFRPEVRHAFRMTRMCGTLEMGAEVYESDNEQRIVCHTCKSRGCTSCGHRASVQWQRERWAALPDVPYKGITFTMPRELWKLFRDNRQLTAGLPALAAIVIQGWITARYGLRVGVIAILHTFNGRLEFNSHVHTMVSAGGLKTSTGSWVESVYYDRDQLMKLWRRAVTNLLRSANRSRLLKSGITPEEIEVLLAAQEERWWSIRIQSFKSREHFLRYAGRYVRRPPIAQRRITYLGQTKVRFWVKDKKLRRRVIVECSLEEFIDRWQQHIPERYQHAMRYFGLFAPRAVSQTSAAIFAIIGQEQRPRPQRRRWADSLKRDFGWDPLLDRKGRRMHWARRLAPKAVRLIRPSYPQDRNPADYRLEHHVSAGREDQSS